MGLFSKGIQMQLSKQIIGLLKSVCSCGELSPNHVVSACCLHRVLKRILFLLQQLLNFQSSTVRFFVLSDIKNLNSQNVNVFKIYIFVSLSLGVAIEFRCHLDAILVWSLQKPKVEDDLSSISLTYEFGIQLIFVCLQYICSSVK